MAKAQRIDVGFTGGLTLALRAEPGVWDEIIGALNDGRSERVLKVTTEESEVAIDLAQVAYVRRDTDDHKVGF
jgi:hypothetical protein